MSLTIVFADSLAAAINDYAKATGLTPEAAAIELATTGVVRRRALADHDAVRMEKEGIGGDKLAKAKAVSAALSAVAPGTGRRVPTDPAARQAAAERAQKELERIQARLAKLGAVATMPTVTSKALDRAQPAQKAGRK